MDFSSSVVDSIFSPAELSAFESQLSALHRSIKETRAFFKEECFKLESSFEATAIASQSNVRLKKKISECGTILHEIIKGTDDCLADDMNFVDEQMKLIRKIKSTNDQMAQIELKSVLGDDVIDTDEMVQELPQLSEESRARFMEIIGVLREILEKEDMPRLLKVLQAIRNGEDYHAALLVELTAPNSTAPSRAVSRVPSPVPSEPKDDAEQAEAAAAAAAVEEQQQVPMEHGQAPSGNPTATDTAAAQPGDADPTASSNLSPTDVNDSATAD